MIFRPANIDTKVTIFSKAVEILVYADDFVIITLITSNDIIAGATDTMGLQMNISMTKYSRCLSGLINSWCWGVNIHW